MFHTLILLLMRKQNFYLQM